MNIHTSKIILRKDTLRENGKASLSLQIFLNGQRVVISLGVSVLPNMFDPIKERIKGNAPENATLDSSKNKALKIVTEANVFDEVLSKSVFKQRFLNSDMYKSTFTTWFDSAITDSRESDNTKGSYRATFRWLSKFKSNITFGELTYKLFNDFDSYLSQSLMRNTVAKHHKHLKKFISIAILEGFKISHPYKLFKIKQETTDRTFLECDELQLFMTLYDSNRLQKHHKRVLRAWLFSSITGGIRYGDLIHLTATNIQKNIVVFTPAKTIGIKGHTLKIPMCQYALKLVEDAMNEKLNTLFPMPNTSLCNTYMKLLAHQLNIDKHVTMHVARHTFATVFLQLGGTIHVLQRILGHSKIEDTNRYVHLARTAKEIEIQRFDALFKVTGADSPISSDLIS